MQRFFLQLDSATSLIQAAKNLMNAVVLTVKASYVASTKYPRQGTVAVSSECFKTTIQARDLILSQNQKQFLRFPICTSN